MRARFEYGLPIAACSRSYDGTWVLPRLPLVRLEQFRKFDLSDAELLLERGHEIGDAYQALFV